MPITGWINFTKSDHQRVSSVLDMLKEAGSVDELGIGTIRDTLADSLFPGISTIQTRPKYFFIISYILRDFIEENNEKSNKRSVSEYLSDREDDIMRIFNGSGKYKDGDGIIGITLTGPNETLSRRPSEIYWNGLRKFNFIKTPHSRSQYLKLLDKSVFGMIKAVKNSGDDQDDPENDYNNYNIKIGSVYKTDWEDSLDIELTKSEASFLLQRLKDQENNLLKIFAVYPHIFKEFTNDKNPTRNTQNNFAVGVRNILNKFPIETEIVKDVLKLAVNFSAILAGTTIAYNYQIQVLRNSEAQEDHLNKWNDFIDNFRNTMIDPNGFNLDVLFETANTTKPKTQLFLKAYYAEITSEKPSLENIVNLVKMQELYLKRNRARLSNGHSAEIDVKKEYGISQLNYRYDTVNNLFTDIFKALENA